MTHDKITMALAREVGLVNVERTELCKRLEVPEGSFQHHVGMTFTDYIAYIEDNFGRKLPVPDKIVTAKSNPTLCRVTLTQAAAKLSLKHGYLHVTHNMVAEKVGVSRPLVAHYLGSAKEMKDCIMEYAIKEGDLKLLCQGLMRPHNEVARNAPIRLQRAAYKKLRSEGL